MSTTDEPRAGRPRGALRLLLAAALLVRRARLREARGSRGGRKSRTRSSTSSISSTAAGKVVTSLGGVLRLSDRRLMQLLAQMQQQGLVVARGQEFELTAEGERVARQVVRAHRLLERYFADEARLPLEHVHAAAERREHALTSDQVEALSASLGHPRLDPHGDPIPGARRSDPPPATRR